MDWLRQLGLGGEQASAAGPTLWADIRSGRAGCAVRIGLSLASATGLVGLVLLVFGGMEMRGGYLREEHMTIGLCLAGAVWCGAMVWIWSTYRRLRTVVKTVFAILGLWTVTIPLCVLVGEASGPVEFLVGGIFVLGLSATALIITFGALRAAGGRPLNSATGQISVHCPRCGYTLVGLKSCQCPECGTAFTIDELIAAQDYAVLRRSRPEIADEGETPEADAPSQAPRALPQGVNE